MRGGYLLSLNYFIILLLIMENKENLENTQNNTWDDVAAIEAAKKIQEEEAEKTRLEEEAKKLEAEKLAKEEEEKKEKEEEAAKKIPKKEKEKTKEMEIVTNVNWVQKTVKKSFVQKESSEQRKSNKREVIVEKTVLKTDENGEVVLDKNDKPILIREEKKIYV